MRAFYSDHFVLPLPEGHKFPMAKYSRLRERILAEGIVAPDDLHEAPAGVVGGPAAGSRRRRTSTPSRPARCRATSSGASAFRGRRKWSSVRADRSARPSPRRARRSMTASPRTWPAARITPLPIAAKASASSTTSPSPPASCSAINYARRIAVVDLDVHQGNGTAAIFSGDDVGLHLLDARREEFPVQEGNERSRRGARRTAPAMRSTSRRCGCTWTTVLNRHQPDFVFYLAGADPFEGDRLGRLKLTIDGLRDAR